MTKEHLPHATTHSTRRDALRRVAFSAPVIIGVPALIGLSKESMAAVPAAPPLPYSLIPNLAAACGNHYTACAQYGNSTQAILESGISAVGAVGSYLSSSGMYDAMQRFLPSCPTSASYSPGQMGAAAAAQGANLPSGYWNWGLPWVIPSNSLVNESLSLGHAPGFLSTLQNSYAANWAAWFNNPNNAVTPIVDPADTLFLPDPDTQCFTCKAPPEKVPYYPQDVAGSVANASVVWGGIGVGLLASGTAFAIAASSVLAFPAVLCFGLAACCFIIAVWLANEAINLAVVTSSISYPPDDPTP